MSILAIFRTFNVLKEIKIYLDYRRIIKEESNNSPYWTRLRLRYDWFGRVYTVINLPPEVTMSRDFPADARPAYVFEELKPVNDYLTKLNLQEVLTPSLKPIEETNGDSFLAVYYFFFRYISIIWIFRFFLEVFAISALVYNWTSVVNFFHNLI
jgi:hypothetical protein